MTAIALQYDLLTERSTDHEYADMLQNIPDLIARVRELETAGDELAEDYGHLEDDLNQLKDRCADLGMQLADADRENGRLRLALGDIYARAGELI